MKKVGIMTLYYKTYNYGAQLQAYALQKAVQALGYECEQICYKWQNADIEHFYSNDKGNTANFREFAFSIPHSKRIYTPETIHEVVDAYDSFICGSDQIWGVTGSMPSFILPHMTLSFVPKYKLKIAYAASIGGAALTTNQIPPIKYWGAKLDVISLREQRAVSYVEKLIGKEVTSVLDPSFLLETSHWKGVSVPPKDNGEFIFVYNIGGNIELSRSATELSKDFGLPLKTISYSENDMAGPKEFLGLIKNAKFVLTNSFHGTVFSIIFGKQFYTFPVDNIQNEFSKNIRILDLLAKVSLENRFVFKAGDADCSVHIDYLKVNKKLQYERNLSLDFLSKSLEINKELVKMDILDKKQEQNRPIDCQDIRYNDVLNHEEVVDKGGVPVAWRHYMQSLEPISTARDMNYVNKICGNEFTINTLKRNYFVEIKRNSIYIKMMKYQMYGCLLDNEPLLKGKVIVYGAGKIGKLMAECSSNKMLCFVDGLAKIKSMAGLQVFHIADDNLKKLISKNGEVTFVITPVWDYEDIYQNIKLHYPMASVVSVEKVVEKIWE